MTIAGGTPTTPTATPTAAATATPPMPIDVLDPRFYDDPWDAYRWLRTTAPLWWDAANGLWVVSRHEDVSHISRHPPPAIADGKTHSKPSRASRWRHAALGGRSGWVTAGSS